MVDAHMAREALLQAGALERYCTPEWVSNAWRLIGWKLDRMESILLGSRTIKTQDIAMDLLKKRCVHPTGVHPSCHGAGAPIYVNMAELALFVQLLDDDPG